MAGGGRAGRDVARSVLLLDGQEGGCLFEGGVTEGGCGGCDGRSSREGVDLVGVDDFTEDTSEVGCV